MQNLIDRYWMRYAMSLAMRAEQEGEIPVGAVVILNDHIIGEGWNRSIIDNDPTAHAEMIAIRQAGQLVGNYRLLGATLYVTLEPCIMCSGAMIHSRIRRLVYGASDHKTGAVASVFPILTDVRHNHQIEVIGGIESEACSSLLSSFFRKRRQEKKANKSIIQI